jgi:hypothetical protein
MKPACFRPSRNAGICWRSDAAALTDMNPTKGIVGCCARAASGHAAAAPPSKVMNSRRLMGYLRRGSHPTTSSNERHVVHHSKF